MVLHDDGTAVRVIVGDPEGVLGMPEDDKNDKPQTFTQEQVNSLLAEQKRKHGEKFADYDDLKAKADQFDKLEEQSKTELQKAIERAEAAEKRAAQFEAKEQVATWAADIVKGSSIPASVLRGSTREELEAHFNDLKALAPTPKRTPVPSGKPDDKPGSRAAEALRSMRQG